MRCSGRQTAIHFTSKMTSRPQLRAPRAPGFDSFISHSVSLWPFRLCRRFPTCSIHPGPGFPSATRVFALAHSRRIVLRRSPSLFLFSLDESCRAPSHRIDLFRRRFGVHDPARRVDFTAVSRHSGARHRRFAFRGFPACSVVARGRTLDHSSAQVRCVHRVTLACL